MPDSNSVALLGAGTMGVGMAHSLLRAGLQVTVWNRTAAKARPLEASGATIAGSAEAAVADAGVVITMLFDADSVAEVMATAAAGMRPDAVWAQTSTVGRDGIARLSQLADQHGLTLVDAPVLGTKGPAEQGTLTVLAAGPDSARAAVQPVFDAIGGKTVWLGSRPGVASAMKLVANSWVATLNAATALAVAQGRAFGLDPQVFLDTMAGGPSDSPYLQRKGAAILAGTFDPQFALDGVLKDLVLIRAATADGGVATVLSDALVELYRAASDAGHGAEDMAAVVAAFTPER